MAKNVLFLLMCLLISTNTIKAGGYTPKYSLKECLAFAINNSYHINKAILKTQEYGYLIKETRSELLPQINANGSFDKYIAIPSTVLPGEIIGQAGTKIPVEMGTKNVLDISANMEQIIFSPSLFTGIKIAKNNYELQKLRSIMTEEEIIFDVSNAFYDILNSMKELESIRYILTKQDSLCILTEQRVDEGLTREVDLNRMQINLTNLKMRETNLLTTISQQKKYLKLLMGMLVNEQLELNERETMDIKPLAENLYSGIQNQTYINILKKEKIVLQLQIRSERQHYLPSLSAVVSGGYQFQSDHLRLTRDPWFNSFLVGVRLSIPLFDGLRKQSRINQLKLQRQQTEYDIAEKEQEIMMNSQNAEQQLVVSFKTVQAQHENLQLAEKTYQQMISLYQEGLADITDVLDVETSLQEAKTSYVKEIVKYRKTEIDMLKANGELKVLLEQ